MGAYHAQLSPSSASRWVSCTASVKAQAGRPNTTSDASRPGTCGHQLSAECLETHGSPDPYLGRVMGFPATGHEDWADKFPAGTTFEHTVEVSQELVEACWSYISFVRNLRDMLGAELIVERQVGIGHVTGEEGARGTSDCILLAGETLITVDAKFGRGKVYAYDVIEPAGYDPLTGEATPPVLRMNLQLALYLLGSLEEYALLGNFTRVKGIIVQPFLNHVSEYECTVEELLALGQWLSERAETTRKNPAFEPSNKNCWFCKAKNDCHARSVAVLSSALDGFEDVETAQPKPIAVPALGKLYGLLPMIRSWCDDVEAKAYAEVEAGRTVVGPDSQPMKLVEGKKPAKQWDDEAEVAAMLKSMRLKQEEMYHMKLITPTDAAKMAPKKPRKKGQEPEPSLLGKTQWNKLQERIQQGNGNPVLALGSDPRPPMPKATDMEEAPPADNSDLF